MTAAANRKRKEAAREKWNEYWGCNSCDGCKRLLKHKEDFPPRCKMMSRIEDEINAGLIPYMDAFINRPADEYERWLIAQRNKFEASHSELTDILQKERVGTGLGNEYWCNINKCWWENFITLDIIRQELDKLKPQRGDTNNHFNSQFKDEELKTLFERLKGCEIDTDSRLEDWVYVCRGGNKPSGHSALKWLKTAALLAVLCDTLFKDTDTDRVWVIAANCFCKSDGGQYNSATFPQSLSRGTISGKDDLLEKLKL